MNVIIRKLNDAIVAFYSGEDSNRLYLNPKTTSSCSVKVYKESSRLTEQDYASAEYKKLTTELQAKFGQLRFKQTWEQLDA